MPPLFPGHCSRVMFNNFFMKIPNVINFRLLAVTSGSPVEGAALVLKMWMPHKNHYVVGPKISDGDGLVTFSRSDMETEIALCRRTSPMDYIGEIGDCKRLELKVMNGADIQRLIDARELWGVGVPEWGLSASQLYSLRAAQTRAKTTTSNSLLLDEHSLEQEVVLHHLKK